MILLAVDIGNTNTKIALMKEEKITARIVEPTSLDYALRLKNLVAQMIRNQMPDGVIVANVVSGKEIDFMNICEQLNLQNVLFVNGSLKYNYVIPEKYKDGIGADILATNAAANAIHKNCIVVDIGTAITFQVLEGSTFKGGIITAGLDMLADILHNSTSLLPRVNVDIPDEFIGFDTVKCIQSGIMYGQASMIEGIIGRIEKIFESKFYTIATGKSAKSIDKLMSRHFDSVNNDLIFNGLRIIYHDNQA